MTNKNDAPANTPATPAVERTVETISAELKSAVAAGETERVLALVAELTDAKLKDAKPARSVEGMTTTEVKRVVRQRLIDLASQHTLPDDAGSYDASPLLAGLNERERNDALASIAQRLSYGAGAAQSVWPAHWPARTVLKNESSKSTDSE